MKKTIEELTREREAVYLLVQKGLSTDEISTITGVSTSHINKLRRVIVACVNGDKDALKKLPDGIVRWGCEKFGVSLDEKKPEKPDVEKPSATEKPPATQTDIEDAIHVATRLMTAEITKVMVEQTELIERKLEQIATIIQSCTKSIEDKANANADIAYKEFQNQSEALSCIKANTKNLRIVR